MGGVGVEVGGQRMCSKESGRGWGAAEATRGATVIDG